MAKPRGSPFQPGNTASQGRPRGSRNQAMLAAQRLFAEYSEPLTKKCIAQASRGDPTALRLSMERVLPPCKSTAVHFEVPEVRTLSELPDAANAVMQAVANGQITPAESQQMMPMLEFLGRCLETAEVGKRLQSLEEQVAARKEP